MGYNFFVLTILNGMTFGALLFLVASGLTIIFGLLRTINLAHGAFYLLGGYVGYTAIRLTNNFWLGLLIGGLSMALLGLLIYKLLLIRIWGQDLRQIVLTVGIAYIIGDGSLILFGGNPTSVPVPELLRGAITFLGLQYPTYRLFVLVAAAVVAMALWYLQSKTKVGAYIRAGVDDQEMLRALGVDISKIFALVYMLGAGLAGTGGVIGGAFIQLYPGAEWEILISALVVIIIGGMGSLPGSVIGALAVGLINSFGQALVPELSYFLLFGPMALLLVFRPYGLLGRPSS
jgi:branched-chain amino acid transport system permease protein